MTEISLRGIRIGHGQPWRSRRRGAAGLTPDDSGLDLLLARGVDRADLPPPRTDRARFLPDPSYFQDMDMGAEAARRGGAGPGNGRDVRRLRRGWRDQRRAADPPAAHARRRADAYIPDRLLEGYGPSGEALVRLEGAKARA